MRIISNSSLLLCALTCLLFSCNNTTSVQKDALTDLVFEVTDHDFGEIPQNVPVEFTFNFSNQGAEPIVLNDVRSSCGCTVPEWPKEPIQPQEKKTIMVSFNAKNEGLFRKTVSVYADGLEEAIKLKIRGIVVVDSTSMTTPDTLGIVSEVE